MGSVTRVWILALACGACASSSDRQATSKPKDQHSTFAGNSTEPAAPPRADEPAPSPAPPPIADAPTPRAAAIEMTFAGDVHFGRYKPWVSAGIAR
jgi:hypothetical protein